MTNMKRRIKNIEDKLNLSEKPITVKIVCFGGELLPDRTQGNITIQYVMYENGTGQ
jgi:hypothetical protein